MTPAFKGDDFDGGVREGVDAIVAQLEGTSTPPALADLPSSSGRAAGCGFPMAIDEPELPPWPMRILLGAFIFGIIGLFTVIGDA